VLIGEYEHSLDVKGRLILPAKIREDMGEKFIITKGLDGCLFGFSQTEWNNFEEKLKIIYERIDNIKQRGIKNIAIISKDENEGIKLYEQISKQYTDTQMISEKSIEYSGGITILPSYYSKGLEFDAVIIPDYNSYKDTILDTKLLYVSLTRAMHLLDIIN